MDDDGDGAQVAASLADWIAELTFTDRETDDVTTLLVAAVVAWATAQGWRVYRRAPSVLPLPAPYAHRRSCVDVGCARQVGPPIVVEIDRSDRRRTVDKLLAEAAAGRIALWVRWGVGGFEPPTPPVRMVTCQVTTRRGLGGRGALHTRLPASALPPPEHTVPVTGDCQQIDLFPTDPLKDQRT